MHWVCAHAQFHAALHRGLFRFSTLAVEQRHKRFKRDLRNSFLGHHQGAIRVSGRAMARIVELNALDRALHEQTDS